MGKSIELLGMVAFQIILAITITTSLLSSDQEEIENAVISSLTEENVSQFLNHLKDTISGQGPDTDLYKVTSFLMEHISADASHTTNITYNVDGFAENDEELNMDKMEYISNVVDNVKSTQISETDMKIEDITIEDHGTKAIVTVSSYERGLMPVPTFDMEKKLVPMSGSSYCEQELSLVDKTIQLVNTYCTTTISISSSNL